MILIKDIMMVIIFYWVRKDVVCGKQRKGWMQNKRMSTASQNLQNDARVSFDK